AQKDWLAKELQASTAEWQIIVTHYPPNFEPCRSTWESYLVEYGVDFYVSGHTHLQHTNTTFGETAFVISGGGGGITSEILPSKTGEDDGYGFMDVVIQHDAMYITRYSHGGVDKKTIVRGVTKVSPRSPKAVSQVAKAEPEVAKAVGGDSLDANMLGVAQKTRADELQLQGRLDIFVDSVFEHRGLFDHLVSAALRSSLHLA
ncbi:PAP4, partial [Symbiodinium necroappetens]